MTRHSTIMKFLVPLGCFLCGLNVISCMVMVYFSTGDKVGWISALGGWTISFLHVCDKLNQRSFPDCSLCVEKQDFFRSEIFRRGPFR
jgi:hypothetical protein